MKNCWPSFAGLFIRLRPAAALLLAASCLPLHVQNRTDARVPHSFVRSTIMHARRAHELSALRGQLNDELAAQGKQVEREGRSSWN